MSAKERIPDVDEILAFARQPEEVFDPRWRALAEGRLSAEEEAALQEEAQKTEEGRSLWELYRPLDAARKHQLLEGLQACLNTKTDEGIDS